MNYAATENEGAPRFSLRVLFVLIGAFAIFIAVMLLLPSLGHGPEPGRRSNCTQNLKQIGIALHNYHDTYKRFPPAYIADADGKPMHSWRILLLPYFEEEALHALYAEYDLSEPWNGPHNRSLADRIPSVYRCPSSPALPEETCFVAIVGPETGWPAPQTLNSRQITDGMSNTIAVTEIADSGIHWMEPRDLTFLQATAGINPPLAKLSVSSLHQGGANCLFWDGSVHYLLNPISPESLRSMFTANGGEVIDFADW